MKQLKILLVEDNPDDIFLTKRILSILGQNSVETAHEGGEALLYLFGEKKIAPHTPFINKPDLIILDMRMPLVDGMDFLESAHQNLRTHNIPVIVISSSRLDQDVDRCFQLGIKAYLTKPIDISELSKALNAYCKKHTVF